MSHCHGDVPCWALSLLLTSTTTVTARAADGAASPAERPLAGVVVSSQARFTADGTQIVTESVVEQTDGSRTTLTQRGGETSGYGMLVNGAPPLLRQGDHVELRARSSQTRRGAPGHTIVAIDRLAPAATPRGEGFHPLHSRILTRETQAPTYWASGCIFVTLDEAGTTQIPDALELSVMRAAFDHWVAATAHCSYLRFVMETPRPVVVGLDRHNVVVFREDRWCTPATDDAPEQCHDRGAAGITTTSYVKSAESDRHAEIVDVDIELNAVDYVFTVDAEAAAAVPGCAMDLASVVTHEVGHLLGLAHSCLMPQDDPNLRDENGQPLLPCQPASALPEPIRESTMAGEASCGERSKATVETDDVLGVCSLFPTSADPGTCAAPAPLEPDAGCGCSVPGASRPAIPWALIAGALLPMWQRSRRRRLDEAYS